MFGKEAWCCPGAVATEAVVAIVTVGPVAMETGPPPSGPVDMETTLDALVVAVAATSGLVSKCMRALSSLCGCAGGGGGNEAAASAPPRP